MSFIESKGGHDNEKRIVKTEVSTYRICYICDSPGVILAGLDVQCDGLFSGDPINVLQRCNIVEVNFIREHL
mgnify:CR=1 FL=1